MEVSPYSFLIQGVQIEIGAFSRSIESKAVMTLVYGNFQLLLWICTSFISEHSF
jgi:hypothetical protein